MLTLAALARPVFASDRCEGLQITDLRFATIRNAPMNCVIIRMDTNAGISGYGEVRDAASPDLAVNLKKYIKGKNPCDVDGIINSIWSLGGHGREGGGVSAIEMAVWDIKGKALGMPVYKILGGTHPEPLRLYADTPEIYGSLRFHPDGRPNGLIVGERLKERMALGYSALKFDFGIGLLEKTSGALENQRDPQAGDRPHVELTTLGIKTLAAFVAEVRSVVGYEVPLAADHFGPITVNSAIKLAHAVETYKLAWLEDILPWDETASLRSITDASEIPILTGEDIYGLDGFKPLIQNHAVDILQPDIATAGGISETKKIAEAAAANNMSVVLHFAGTPIGFAASLHAAAASGNVTLLENHSIDVPWWGELVSLTGSDSRSLITNGFANVPEGPGLGVEPNEAVIRAHLGAGGYFDATPD